MIVMKNLFKTIIIMIMNVYDTRSLLYAKIVKLDRY